MINDQKIQNIFFDIFNIIVPDGIIIPYTGNQIPRGWILCDGNNDTPNLQNRFILGNGKRRIGEIGGEEMTNLTVEHLPSHSHSANYNVWILSGSWIGYCSPAGCGIKRTNQQTAWRQNDGVGGNINIHATGNSWAHNNMPPYYVSVFIMKRTIPEKNNFV